MMLMQDRYRSPDEDILRQSTAADDGGHMIDAMMQLFAPSIRSWVRGERAGRPQSAPGPLYDAMGDLGDAFTNLVSPEVKGATLAAKEFPAIAGPVLFQSRPWIRDLIGKVAGKKWVNRYAEDIPKPTNEIALDAMRDYYQKVGSEPGTFGLEWEARSKNLPPSWKSPDNPGLPTWESKLPKSWELKREHLRDYPDVDNPGQRLFGGEAITKNPLVGWEGIKRFLTQEGPQVEATLRGGRFGGGGHIHTSLPGGEKWSRDLSRALYLEGLKAEPYILPPVPSYKQNSTRTYSPSSLEKLANRNPEDKLWAGQESRGPAFLGLPQQRTTGSLLFRNELYPKRPEFRNFYSPENTGEWGEDILAVQAIIDLARQRSKSPMPQTVGDILDEVYGESILPNRETIRDIHKNRWYPEGIHEGGSPYANGLVDPWWERKLRREARYDSQIPGLTPEMSANYQNIFDALDSGQVARSEIPGLEEQVRRWGDEIRPRPTQPRPTQPVVDNDPYDLLPFADNPTIPQWEIDDNRILRIRDMFRDRENLMSPAEAQDVRAHLQQLRDEPFSEARAYNLERMLRRYDQRAPSSPTAQRYTGEPTPVQQSPEDRLPPSHYMEWRYGRPEDPWQHIISREDFADSVQALIDQNPNSSTSNWHTGPIIQRLFTPHPIPMDEFERMRSIFEREGGVFPNRPSSHDWPMSLAIDESLGPEINRRFQEIDRVLSGFHEGWEESYRRYNDLWTQFKDRRMSLGDFGDFERTFNQTTPQTSRYSEHWVDKSGGVHQGRRPDPVSPEIQRSREILADMRRQRISGAMQQVESVRSNIGDQRADALLSALERLSTQEWNMPQLQNILSQIGGNR